MVTTRFTPIRNPEDDGAMESPVLAHAPKSVTISWAQGSIFHGAGAVSIHRRAQAGAADSDGVKHSERLPPPFRGNFEPVIMDEVCEKLVKGSLYIERNPELVKSMTSFPYIASSL
jgi:hypothetical protein